MLVHLKGGSTVTAAKVRFVPETGYRIAEVEVEDNWLNVVNIETIEDEAPVVEFVKMDDDEVEFDVIIQGLAKDKREAFMDDFIALVEKYNAMCGGGFKEDYYVQEVAR